MRLENNTRNTKKVGCAFIYRLSFPPFTMVAPKVQKKPLYYLWSVIFLVFTFSGMEHLFICFHMFRIFTGNGACAVRNRALRLAHLSQWYQFRSPQFTHLKPCESCVKLLLMQIHHFLLQSTSLKGNGSSSSSSSWEWNVVYVQASISMNPLHMWKQYETSMGHGVDHGRIKTTVEEKLQKYKHI